MLRSLVFAACMFTAVSTYANDRGWLNVNKANSCWDKLGDGKLNTQKPHEFDDSGLGLARGGSKDVLLTIHSSTGTTTVFKNGGCSSDVKLTSDIWASNRIDGLVARLAEFKPDGTGFKRTVTRPDGSDAGSEFMQKDLLDRTRSTLIEILEECALAKGRIGETARASLTLLKRSSRVQPAARTVN